MTIYTEFWPYWDPEEQRVTKRDLMRLLTAALATITVDPMFAPETGSINEVDTGFTERTAAGRTRTIEDHAEAA